LWRTVDVSLFGARQWSAIANGNTNDVDNRG
jgi:hypothetical protein